MSKNGQIQNHYSWNCNSAECQICNRTVLEKNNAAEERKVIFMEDLSWKGW